MAHENAPSRCPICGTETAGEHSDAFCETCLAAAEAAWPRREPSLRDSIRDPEHRAETQAWLNSLFSDSEDADDAYEDGCACGRGDVVDLDGIDGQIVAFVGGDGTEYTIEDEDGCACGRGDVIDLDDMEGRSISFEDDPNAEGKIEDDDERRGPGGGCGGSWADHEWTDAELGLAFFRKQDEKEDG